MSTAVIFIAKLKLTIGKVVQIVGADSIKIPFLSHAATSLILKKYGIDF